MNRFAILALVSAATLFAQNPPDAPASAAAPAGAPTKAPPRNPATIISPQQRMMVDPQYIDRLIPDLTPEQRAKFEALSAEHRQKVEPLEARVRTARKELDDKINAEQLDEAGVRARAQEIGGLEADVAVAKANRLAKLRQFMTPEQVKRFIALSPTLDRRISPMNPVYQSAGTNAASGPAVRSIPSRRVAEPQSQPQPSEPPK